MSDETLHKLAVIIASGIWSGIVMTFLIGLNNLLEYIDRYI